MRWRVGYAVKALLAHTLYSLGVLDLWRSRALRQRAVVLMYHRVLSAEARAATASHPGYLLSDATFARQMAYLKRCFTVLSERQFVQHLDEGRPFPDSSCLITFDDGWHDNLTHALPVLRRHDLPATIYLPVNFVGSRRLFWREGLTHGLVAAVQRVRSGAEPERLRAVLRAHGFEEVLAVTDNDPRRAVVEIVAQQARRGRQDDGALLDALQNILHVDIEALPTPDTFLSWAEVADMAAAGVSFGAHGVEHRLLGALPHAEAEHEVRESKRVVADHVDGPVLGISYPNGSVTPAVRAMVAAAGYRVAYTTEPGTVAAGDDRFMIKRVNVHEDMTGSTPMFLARIVGLF